MKLGAILATVPSRKQNHCDSFSQRSIKLGIDFESIWRTREAKSERNYFPKVRKLCFSSLEKQSDKDGVTRRSGSSHHPGANSSSLHRFWLAAATSSSRAAPTVAPSDVRNIGCHKISDTWSKVAQQGKLYFCRRLGYQKKLFWQASTLGGKSAQVYILKHSTAPLLY